MTQPTTGRKSAPNRGGGGGGGGGDDELADLGTGRAGGATASTAPATAVSANPGDSMNLMGMGAGGAAAPADPAKAASELDLLSPAGCAHVLEIEEYSRILLKEVDIKNAEIASLKVALQDALERASANEPSKPPSGNDQEEATLIDLAKKVRKLTVSLEKEKVKNTKAAQQLHEAARTREDLEQTVARQAQALRDGLAESEMHAELQAVRGKLASAQQKLEHERNAAAALRAELQRAHRVLAAEIGPDVPLPHALQSVSVSVRAAAGGAASDEEKDANDEGEAAAANDSKAASVVRAQAQAARVTGGPPAWKGRAQQITMLKDKIKALTRQLEHAKRTGGASRMDVRRADKEKGGSQHQSQQHHQQLMDDDMFMEDERDRHARVLRDLEAKNRRVASALARDHAKLQDEFRAMAVLAERHEARVRTLTLSLRDAKSKLKTVLEKSGNDDTLIRALQEETHGLKAMLLRRGNMLGASNTPPSPAASASRALSPTGPPTVVLGGGAPGAGAAGSAGAARGGGLVAEATSVADELQQLRRLRQAQSSEIQAKTELISQLEVQLQNERRARASWHPPGVTPHVFDGQGAGGSGSGSGGAAGGGKDAASMHPLERDALTGENKRLAAKVELLQDEIRVLKHTVHNANTAKERELALYCRMLDDARRTAARAVASAAAHAIGGGEHGGAPAYVAHPPGSGNPAMIPRARVRVPT